MLPIKTKIQSEKNKKITFEGKRLTHESTYFIPGAILGLNDLLIHSFRVCMQSDCVECAIKERPGWIDFACFATVSAALLAYL